MQQKAWASYEIERLAKKAIEESGLITTVVANPEEVSTANLTKLQVGDTVYEIPSLDALHISYTVDGSLRTWSYTDSDEGPVFNIDVTIPVGEENGSVELYSNAGYSIHLYNVVEIEVSNGSGEAGQVLGHDSQGNLAWLTPASGGTQLYRHRFTDNSSNIYDIITTNATPIAYDDTQGAYYVSAGVIICAYYGDNTTGDVYMCFYVDPGMHNPIYIYISGLKYIERVNDTIVTKTMPSDMTDTVTPL